MILIHPHGAANPLRLMIVGAGKMGRAHLEVLQRIAGVEVAGVVSRSGTSAERLAAEFGASAAGADWREVAGRCSPHAAIVAVAHLESEQTVFGLLEAGLHVLAEKPVALESAAVERLAEFAEGAGVLAMAAVNRRFFPAVQAAVDAAYLHGRLLGVTVVAPDPVRPLEALGSYDVEVYRNWTMMNTLHAIDLFTLAAGEGWLTAGEAEHDPETGEVSVTALIRFRGGVLGVFISHGGSTGRWELRLHTTGAEIAAAPLERGTVTINGVPHPLPESKDPRGYRPGLYAQDLAFVQAIREIGRLPRPCSDFRDHALSLRLAEQIQLLRGQAALQSDTMLAA